MSTDAPLPYRWEISRDYFPDPNARPASNCNAAGVMGPRGCDPELRGGERPFRMYDDDGELYYEGTLFDPQGVASGFEPLDHFGTPNAGCTEIRYRTEQGAWETL